MSSNDEVLIIGAGLAGLCCGFWLKDSGIPFTIVEGADAVGGRVRTDKLDGFLLDRGFQIFLTAYPEAAKVLNYSALKFKSFYPGAMVRTGGKFHKLADPFRQPMQALETLLSPIGTMSDKMRVATLRTGMAPLQKQSSSSTLEALRNSGFSDAMIDDFFKPFFGGIFLEPNLESSSEMFEFLFKTFAEGENVIPKTGMQAIPEQIASKLPAGSIKLKQKVVELNGTTVTMENGEQMHYKTVVIATEEPEYRRLMKQAAPKQFRSQTCVYYSADFAPIDEPILVLNGDKDGIVNNFCVPSNVSSNYAPAGKALMSVSIIGDVQLTEEQIDQSVRATLTSWFGNQVSKWKNLRTYRVKYALPDQSPQAKAAVNHNYKTGPLLYNCGDYKETGSINGAMESGRKVAEAIIAEHKKK